MITTLGIAHPTGYPFFIILGRVALLIPISLPIILRVNIFVVVLDFLAVGVFYFIVRLVLNTISQQKTNARDNTEKIIAAASSLVLAFSSTFWSQSTAIEVYALHVVCLSMVLYTALRAASEMESETTMRWFALAAFALGLSFGNHMTTVLLLPGLFYYFFASMGIKKNSFIVLAKMLLFFFLGLSIYFYFPIRSSNTPLMDWGHPATFERFLWHTSGKQFRVWMFQGWDVAKKQFSFYINDLPNEFYWPSLAVVFVGMVRLFEKNRKLFIFFLLLIIGTLAYSVNYDIFDIDSYFLLSYVAIGLFFAIGLAGVVEWFKTKWKIKLAVIGCFVFLFPIIQLIQNYKEVDQSKNYIPEDFTQSVMNAMPQNAVVFSGIWDYFISPSIYYQYVNYQRTDITIINISLLKDRSWYYIQMRNRCPWLLGRCKNSIDAFLEELDLFEHDKPFNPATIQMRWQEMLDDFLVKTLPDHPVFVDARVENEFSRTFKRTPYNMLIRLSAPNDTTCSYQPLNLSMRDYDMDNIIVQNLDQYKSLMHLWDMRWLEIRNRAGKK